MNTDVKNFEFEVAEFRENGVITKVKFSKCRLDCWNNDEHKTCQYFGGLKDKKIKGTNKIQPIVICTYKPKNKK